MLTCPIIGFAWGPTWFLGTLWLLNCEESEDTVFSKKGRLNIKFSPNFPHVKTEEWRPEENVKIKCEDCNLKCEYPELNFGGLDLLPD